MNNPTLKQKDYFLPFISGYLAEYFVLREGGGCRYSKGMSSSGTRSAGHDFNTLSITGQGNTFFPDSIVVTGEYQMPLETSVDRRFRDTVRMREADFQFLEVDQSGVQRTRPSTMDDCLLLQAPRTSMASPRWKVRWVCSPPSLVTEALSRLRSPVQRLLAMRSRPPQVFSSS